MWLKSSKIPKNGVPRIPPCPPPPTTRWTLHSHKICVNCTHLYKVTALFFFFFSQVGNSLHKPKETSHLCLGTNSGREDPFLVERPWRTHKQRQQIAEAGQWRWGNTTVWKQLERSGLLNHGMPQIPPACFSVREPKPPRGKKAHDQLAQWNK